MAAKVGITIVKRFTYRGDANEEFSNTYHLTGSVPSDATAWRTLFDALVTEEKKVYPSSVSVIRGYGYATDNPADDSVFQVDLTVAPNSPVAGTFARTGGQDLPGDCAVWVRWKTSRTNTKGKAIYLRKYFHPATCSTGGSTDVVLASHVTALAAFGTKLMDGTFTDGRKITAQTYDDTITATGASAYVTTRTLKRRGKRPGS